MKEEYPGINTLGSLDLEYHITRGRRKIWRGFVPVANPSEPQSPMYSMQSIMPMMIKLAQKYLQNEQGWKNQYLPECS